MFRTEALRQRIELINHLIEFGRQMILIQGPAGFGKSTMLEAIDKAAEPGWVIIRLNAGPTLNRESLLEKISANLDFEPTEKFSEEEVCSEIQRRLEILDKSSQIVVVAIDDSHELPAETHSLLLKLAHNDEAAAEIRVVLTADNANSSLLDNLQTSAEQKALIHTVDIPKMDREQTASLLSWWQDQQETTAGLGKDEKFSSASIDEIYEQSEGIPGNILVLARQYRLRGANTQLRADPVKKYIVGGIIAFLAVAIFSFFGKDVGDQEEEQLDIELPELATEIENTDPADQSASSIAQPLEPREDVPDDATTDIPAPTNNLNLKLQTSSAPGPLGPLSNTGELGDMVSAALAEGVLPSDSEKLEETIDTENGENSTAPSETSVPVLSVPTAAELGTQKTLAAPQPEAEPSRTNAPLEKITAAAPKVSIKLRNKAPGESEEQSLTTVVPARPDSPSVAEKSAYTLAKLLRESPNGYVLQLFGVRNHDAARKYLDKHAISANSTVVASMHEGSPWFVVIYGQYDSRQSATAAAGLISKKLPNVKPWPRPVSSLK